MTRLFLKSYLSHYSGITKKSWESLIILLTNSLAGGIIFFIAIYLANTFHFSVDLICYIMSCYGVGTAIGGVAGGALSDRLGSNIVSVLSLLLRAFSFLCLIKITNEHYIMLCMFFLGMSNYSFLTSNKHAALKDYPKGSEKRMRVLAVLYAFSNFGIGLSALMMGWISKKNNEQSFHLMFITSAGLLIIAACYIIYLEFRDKTKSVIETDKNNATAIEEAESEDDKKYKNPLARYLGIVCLFLIGVVMAQRTSTYSLYLQKVFPHLGLHWLGLLFMINPFMIMFLQTPIINFFHKKDKFIILGIGAFLYGLGSFILSFAHLYVFAVVSTIILTVGEMLSMSTANYILFLNAKPDKKGYGLGLFQSTYAVSTIIGPIGGGILFKHYGGLVIWYVSGVIGCLSLVMCLLGSKILNRKLVTNANAAANEGGLSSENSAFKFILRMRRS